MRRIVPASNNPASAVPRSNALTGSGDRDRGADNKCEVLVRPLSPRPYIGAGRHAESGEGLADIGRGIRQGTAGRVTLWHDEKLSRPYSDEVSATAIG